MENIPYIWEQNFPYIESSIISFITVFSHVIGIVFAAIIVYRFVISPSAIQVGNFKDFKKSLKQNINFAMCILGWICLVWESFILLLKHTPLIKPFSWLVLKLLNLYN